MEKQENRSSKRRRKTRAFNIDGNDLQSLTDSGFGFSTDDFALLLAALCNLHKQSHFLSLIIKKCLKKLHASLDQILPNNPVLSLLPILVGSK